MYKIKWGYKNDIKHNGFLEPDSISLTLPIAQKRLSELQDKFPGLRHWIVDSEGKEII